MSTFRPQDHQKREAELEGWPIGVTSYRLDAKWICHVDNVSPGAIVARGSGATRDLAEQAALAIAAKRLRTTKRLRKSLDDLHASVTSLEATLPTSKR